MAKKGGGAKVSATEVVPRYLQIMRSLPVHPDSTDVANVMQALAHAGFIDAADPGDRRMVQRDLQKLSAWFEEDIERVSQNPARYAWKRTSVLAPVAGFSNVQLCTLHILERFLRTALPPAVTEVLDRQFEEARSQMGKAAWRHARWPKKIRVEGLGFHPAPPKVTPGVYEEAYRALWDDKVCRVKLRTPHAGDGDVLDLHPLGLLLRDGLLTMVALEGGGNEPKEFHLHRMRSARALDQDRRAFPFDLATYESTKDPFDPSLPRKVRLVILFDRAAPLYPAERPFSGDQRLTKHDAQRDRLEATVANTRYLVAWLRGYGPRVEVLEPKELRSLFATEAAAAHTMYGGRARRPASNRVALAVQAEPMTKDTRLLASFTRSECVTFKKTNERFGGLSNMCGGYMMRVNEVPIRSVEAIYQACRFPHMPEVQRAIIKEASPMIAKMKGKPFRDQSRADWDLVRVDIMRWCLRVKLAQHWERFGGLFRQTGKRPILEESRKDRFWGAVPLKGEPNTLVGENVLGSLLEEMRDLANGERLLEVAPLQISEFLLFGQPIRKVVK